MNDLGLIVKFDPWHSSLCTCPPKLTFNPYTGCDHKCIYCYARGYIPRFSECRPKINVVPRLEKEAQKLKGETVSISNSSDPYPNMEAETGLTRKCLEILSKHDCKIQIITKSDLVTRDMDLLDKTSSTVSLTITSDNDEIAECIEPDAPSYSRRLQALALLEKKGIPASVRIDPIIPFLNDKPATLIEKLAAMGVKHVTCSTLKIKPEIWKNLNQKMPELARKLRPLYFGQGEKKGRYVYLPASLRFDLMKTVADLARKHGVEFGTCREGLPHLNTVVCDGSWLLEGRKAG